MLSEKKLVKCRNCYQKESVVRTLCEVIRPGLVVVMRMKSKEGREHTIVEGNDFKITCGKCAEVIYIHERKS